MLTKNFNLSFIPFNCNLSIKFHYLNPKAFNISG